MWHLWSIFNASVPKFQHPPSCSTQRLLRNVKLGLSTPCWLISELPKSHSHSLLKNNMCSRSLQHPFWKTSHLFEPGYPKRYPKRYRLQPWIPQRVPRCTGRWRPRLRTSWRRKHFSEHWIASRLGPWDDPTTVKLVQLDGRNIMIYIYIWIYTVYIYIYSHIYIYR